MPIGNAEDTYKSPPGPDHKPLSSNEQWGEDKNPVEHTPMPGRNLKKVGGEGG